MLLDPAIEGPAGHLELEFGVRFDEKRYVKDNRGAELPAKGKVLVETVTVEVRSGETVLFRKAYRGHKARRAEAFGSEIPVEGGYLVKVNFAEVDDVEIARRLLENSRNYNLAMALSSKNKYIHAAAIGLSDGWRRADAAHFDAGSDDVIDDD